MLLTLTTTHQPATDLGYLLAKNPANLHEVELSFGRALVFYPEARLERCTAALFVEVDTIGLVRGKSRQQAQLDQYVNDRPYVSSSFLSVAMGRAYGTALSGRSKQRPDLVVEPLPLEARIVPLSVRGASDLPQRLFTPLGYEVDTAAIPLDPAHPDWGDSRYVALTLRATLPLRDLLQHLLVLFPVLDNDQHFLVGTAEAERLLRRGEGWLAGHPERELITRRFLRRRSHLVRDVLARLDEAVESTPAEEESAKAAGEEALEAPVRLNDLRLARVAELLRERGGQRVLDLGCGDGKLVRRLLDERQFAYVLGIDVAAKVVARAGERLRLDRMPSMQRKRVDLLQGSLTYRDDRLRGFDAAAAMEVVEHLDLDRLIAFEAAVFGHARPTRVVITTPNREYNQLYEGLAPGALRHPDHRFEWTRAEFAAWSEAVAVRNGYSVRLEGIGPAHDAWGSSTQVGIFDR